MEIQIERPIDELGRIVIPIEFRRVLKWNDKDVISVSINNDTQELILHKLD